MKRKTKIFTKHATAIFEKGGCVQQKASRAAERKANIHSNFFEHLSRLSMKNPEKNAINQLSKLKEYLKGDLLPPGIFSCFYQET
jgi:hypothetical protein